MMARSYNHWCREKATSIPNSKCMSVSLGIRHADRRIILPSVTCPTLSYISTLSHKWHDCQGKVTEYEMCVLNICTTFV
jgi:hypothetical protein